LTALNPNATSVLDLCTEALKDAGALGIGQEPGAQDLSDAWIRLQWVLQWMNRKRWLIYHLVTYLVTSTGQNTPYSVGPTGGPGGIPQISVGTYGLTTRPNRIESAFFRQLINIPNGPVDYPLKLVNSMEDYNKIALKGLTNFQLLAFYDPAWNQPVIQSAFGMLYCWPWPQSGIYQVGITMREQLPASFLKQTDHINLPYEYFDALVSILALRLRPKYGLGTYPGDTLPQRAKDGLQMLRGGNTAITNLDMPPGLSRYGLYNIYSDQNY
jgi:hypothetical protein